MIDEHDFQTDEVRRRDKRMAAVHVFVGEAMGLSIESARLSPNMLLTDLKKSPSRTEASVAVHLTRSSSASWSRSG